MLNRVPSLRMALARVAGTFFARADAAGERAGSAGPSPATNDNAACLPAGDAEIAAAMETARRTLPRFFELSRAGLRGAYLLKMSIEQAGEIEHIWMEIDSYRDGVFLGRLANDPRNPGRYRFGDEVGLRETDVEDWMIRTDTHRYGAYTIRALLKQMPPADAEALRRQIRD